MDEIRTLQRLARSAGRSGPPGIDVSGAVVARIASTLPERPNLPYAAAAAVAILAAAAMCTLALLNAPAGDPLADMLNAVTTVI